MKLGLSWVYWLTRRLPFCMAGILCGTLVHAQSCAPVDVDQRLQIACNWTLQYCDRVNVFNFSGTWLTALRRGYVCGPFLAQVHKGSCGSAPTDGGVCVGTQPPPAISDAALGTCESVAGCLNWLYGQIRHRMRHGGPPYEGNNGVQIRPPFAVGGIRGRALGSGSERFVVTGRLLQETSAPQLAFQEMRIALPANSTASIFGIPMVWFGSEDGDWIRIAVQGTTVWEARLADLPHNEIFFASLPAASLSNIPQSVVVNLHGSGTQDSRILLIEDEPVPADNVADLQPYLHANIAGVGSPGFSGDGQPAVAAALDTPSALAVDDDGNIFVADAMNHRIRRIDAVSGTISTIAGNGVPTFSGDGGPPLSASLSSPRGLAIDAQGRVLVADTGNHAIRRIDLSSDRIITIAGTGVSGYDGNGSPASVSRLNAPTGVAVDNDGNVWIADRLNHRIRMLDLQTNALVDQAGNGFSSDDGTGTPLARAIGEPFSLVIAGSGLVYFSDVLHGRIRRLDRVENLVDRWFGGFESDGSDPWGLAIRPVNNPGHLALDVSGGVWFADTGSHTVRRIDASDRSLSLVAGTGRAGYETDPGAQEYPALSSPVAALPLADGSFLIAETGGHRVRLATPRQNDIWVDLGEVPDGAQLNTPISVPVRFGNRGPAIARVVRLGLRSNGNMAITGLQAPEGLCRRDFDVTCALPSLAAGAEQVITIELTPTTTGENEVAATISATGVEIEGVSDNAPARVVQVFAQLAVFSDGFE